MTTVCLKVDVCTHDGMRDGVPRLLDLFARHGVHASFFLSFGPDNSGKAALNVFRPGFLRKMVRSAAPSTYGLRTMLSGTLLPARPIATAFPGVVRRIRDEGHEVAVHAWDHRRWQDHLERMPDEEIREHLTRAFAAYQDVLGEPPAAWGAPAWCVTPRSLAVADTFGLAYASDLRGGPMCRLRVEGRELRTLQIPTAGPCVEELLAIGVTDDSALEAALVEGLVGADTTVLAVHAEIEGGRWLPLLDRLLGRFSSEGTLVRTLRDVAGERLVKDLPLRDLVQVAIPGRSGRVSSSAPPGGDAHR